MAQQPPTQEQGNFGFAVLGFCIPIVGLVLFLVWNQDRPGDAKMAGIGALVSVIAGILFYVLGFLIILGGAL